MTNLPPRNIELLARIVDNQAYRDPMKFADRFAARREALRLVESDHMTAALMWTFASLAEHHRSE